MSAVCPKCGVAVVPGYVKCPKCQATLPQRRSAVVAAGGTSSHRSGGISPWMIAVAAAALVAVLVVVLGGGDDKPADVDSTTPTASPDTEGDQPSVADESPGLTPVQPVANDPTLAVRDLERALKKERLWGTVEVVGSRVEVRSAACREATMIPVIDAAIPALREGGVTKLRCLEQAGAVVFERDL